VVINDSGIDGRHPDLYYTLPPLNSYASKVIQNVLISSDPLTPYQVPLPIPPGQVTPLSYEENIQDTDLNVAHGTHCSGIVGGTGHFALATSDTLADPANAPLLDFSGLDQSQLPSDHYYLVVTDTVTDALGNKLDGEFNGSSSFTRPGEVDRADSPSLGMRVVTSGYFETLRIPLRSGRTFDAHDDERSAEVAIVNE